MLSITRFVRATIRRITQLVLEAMAILMTLTIRLPFAVLRDALGGDLTFPILTVRPTFPRSVQAFNRLMAEVGRFLAGLGFGVLSRDQAE